MNKCTEGWPNAPGDVSPDAYEAFLAHVAGCSFHEQVLDAEEEEIRSKARLARGLDPYGRILVGSDLRRTLKQHDRIHALWKQAAKEKTSPFKGIYLSNRGEDIAGSGKFFDFRKYEGFHLLDPQAGLQIWGVIGEGRSIPPVLLGSYRLHGVRHTGEEHLFPLENGYTVGLRVEQVSERGFNIGFRCVENEVFERERIEAARNNQTGSVDDVSSLPSSLIKQTLHWVRPSWKCTTARLRSLALSWIHSEPLSLQHKIESCAIWAMAFFVGLTAMVWLDQSFQLKARSSSDVGKKQSTSTNAKPAKPGRVSGPKFAGSGRRSRANQTQETKKDVRSDSLAAPNEKPRTTE